MPKKIRVLVVDDSALVRRVMAEGLAGDDGIHVVGTACDPFDARDQIVRLKPDVLTLDVEMPRMDGVEFLRRFMPQYPLPVVMVSALTQRGKATTLDALSAGAVDFVAKPSKNVAGGLGSMMMELRTKVKIAATANVSHWKGKANPRQSRRITTSLAESTDKVIAIGASTGGTEATKAVLASLPKPSPGIVIVQHMPAGFTKMYADRLNEDCPHHCVEASDGDRIIAGRAYIAAGDKHMEVVRSGGHYLLRCRPGPKVSGHCPSVDVLFKSTARALGRNAVGVLLTGMGRDGADGLLEMRQAGARTMAQDEATCVVFGMPKEAQLNGGAERMVPLHDVAGAIVNALTLRKAS